MSHKFITHDEDGDLLVKVPYSEEYLEKFKALVDKDSRKWRPDEKLWAVDGGYEEALEKLIRDYFGGGAGKRGSEPLPRTKKAYAAARRAAARPTPARPTPSQIGSVDDYVERIAREDVSHVIKELTAKIGLLTYELGAAQSVARTWEAQAQAQHRRDERTINDLTFQLTMAQAKAQASTPKEQGPSTAAYRTLHLTPDAPPELVAAAHKALILKFHPDKGGDLERAKQINNARDAILGG